MNRDMFDIVADAAAAKVAQANANRIFIAIPLSWILLQQNLERRERLLERLAAGKRDLRRHGLGAGVDRD